jgi:hypothetical protein
MAQSPERYLIGPGLRDKLRDVIARVDGAPLGAGGSANVPVRLQSVPQRPKGSKYFRLTGSLTPCLSAFGVEVRITDVDCLAFEDVENGLADEELFDVSNSVRVYNLVKQLNINTPAPTGTVVEAIRDSRYGGGSGGDEVEFFWKILQVMSCDCGSPSSSSSSSSEPSDSSYSSSGSSYSSSSSGSDSSSSSSGSSGSGSSSSSSEPSGSGSSSSGSPPPPPPPCENIEVVTDVQCVGGQIQVTKTTICAVVVD